MPVRVTVWNEFHHEKTVEVCRRLYPRGIHEEIASAVRERLGEGAVVRTATLDQPDQGLGESVLGETDVLFWWGHAKHEAVTEQTVDRVQRRVLEGMGLVVLHSGHHSKVFRRLMGTGCGLKWRDTGELERLWVVDPGHPIADGLGDHFELPTTEMYGEFFDVPPPDELVFISWFAGGEVFRSGCCWRRGKGRVFYFRPGHETFPIYHDANVRRVLANAARYVAAQSDSPYTMQCPNIARPGGWGSEGRQV